jgi:predicted small secreted protein
MNKKTLSVWIVLAVAAVLAGCEGNEKVGDDSKPAAPPTYVMVPSQKEGN